MRMGGRENSTVAVGVLLFAAFAGACRRAPPPSPAPAQAQPPASAEALLAGVVDPWSWPRAAAADDRARAVEDIGPYERSRAGDPTSPFVNTNAHYWTALAGIAWDRDVDIDFDREPVDLDGDGRPDTQVTRHIHAKGGVLANPALFGLTPTPDDPRGHVGHISASTGVLGLREALRPDGKPSGEIGMTCWLCHGSAAEGRVSLGLPGNAFDYGLLLATAAVLDDANADAATFRRARGFPSGRTVRARLLLAGPGRQDLTGEFGLDVTVPGTHSARYPGTARVRQGTRGIVNPISVPGILAAPGLALENWSGSEDAAAPWLERLIALTGSAAAKLPDAFGLPGDDRGATRRALLFDMRNLGTLGLQHDSFPGLLWSDAIYGQIELSAAATAAIPSMYAAAPVRRRLAAEAAAWQQSAADRARTMGAESVARGRSIFAERIVGTIANRQIFKHAPRVYAAAKIDGPVLAPIDATKPLDAKLAVRCADCHSAAPLENVRALAENPPPLGRCTHCHLSHSKLDEWDPSPNPLPAKRGEGSLIAIASLTSKFGAGPAAEAAFCAGCHARHRDFGPMVWSSSRLFPFDADGDGDAQGDPAADRRAGGIGTEALLAFDVPVTQRPFALDVGVIPDPARPGRVGRARIGASWVRAAPLVALRASAPYLHNGSVPTLRALLEPAARRPVSFPLGAAGFVLDTRIAGNGNQGHEFGTALSPADKQDLLAFLETL
jgi:processive rubber oxygenase RoxA-like protein